MANDAELRIGGNIDELKAATDKAAAEVKRMSDQMQSSLNSLGGMFSKVQGQFAAFAAIMAGGAGFQKAINAVKEQTSEAMGLAKQLGITAEEANVLSAALGNAFVSHEAYASAVHAVTRAINKNGEGFKEMGIQVKDSSGKLRPMQDIVKDTVKALEQYKAGADRNIMANQLLGKNYEDLLSLMKLNEKAFADAREEIQKYHKQIDPDAVKAYRAAMKDAGDAVEGVTLAVGRGAMPIFTQLSGWFAQSGPAATEATIVAMRTVGDVFSAVQSVVSGLWNVVSNATSFIGNAIENTFGVRVASVSETFVNVFRLLRVTVQAFAYTFELAFEGLRGALEVTGAVLMAFSETAIAALTPGKSASATWASEVKKIEATVSASASRIAAVHEKYAVSIPAALTDGFDGNAEDKKPGGGTKNAHDLGGGGKEAKDQVAIWKSMLEDKKEAEGSYFKDSLQSDIAYWEEKLNHVKRGSKEERAVKHELYGLHKQDAQANLAADVATIEYQITLAKADTAKKVDLAKQEAELIKNTYGEKSKEYIAQLRKIEDAERAHRETLDKLELERIDHAKAMNISSLELARENLRFRKEMGDISAVQELQALRALKEQEYQIELQAANDRLDFIKNDPVAKKKALDDIEQMEQKHGIEMAKNANDTALAVKTAWEKMLDPITSAFDTSIKGMIMGTTTLQKAMANIGNAIAGEFVNLGLKMVKNWATTELAKTQLTQAGSMSRSILEKLGLVQTGVAQKAAAVETVSTKAVEAEGVVGANAAEAASGAAASQASIPFAGWALAGAAFAGVMAMVMGAKSSIPHASGGFDIPAGVNPLTQLHAEEMVLPAHIANPLRENLANGGGSGGDIHLHVSAIDGDSVRRMFLNHGPALSEALRRQARNFTPLKT